VGWLASYEQREVKGRLKRRAGRNGKTRDWPAEISRSLLLWRRVSAIFPRKECPGTFSRSHRKDSDESSCVSFDSDLLGEGDLKGKKRGRRMKFKNAMDFMVEILSVGLERVEHL